MGGGDTAPKSPQPEKFSEKENGSSLYDRWVDDTFVKNKIADRNHISQTFHSFHKNLEFTVEVAKEVSENGKTLKFIPVLDVGVYGTLWAIRASHEFIENLPRLKS